MLHKVAVTQFAGNRPKNARATRIVARRDDDGGVVVEPDIAAIGSAIFFGDAHDDRRDHLALFDGAVGLRRFDRRFDQVSDTGPALLGRQDANAHDLFCAGVIGHLEPSLRLIMSLLLVFTLWFNIGRELGHDFLDRHRSAPRD